MRIPYRESVHKESNMKNWKLLREWNAVQNYSERKIGKGKKESHLKSICWELGKFWMRKPLVDFKQANDKIKTALGVS